MREEMSNVSREFPHSMEIKEPITDNKNTATF